MPVSIYDLVEDRKTIRIPGYDLSVTYRPNSLTPAKELLLLQTSPDDEDEEEDEDNARAKRNIIRQIRGFCDLVEAWDFLGPLAEKDGARLDIPKGQEGDLESQAWVEDQGGQLLIPTGQPVPIQEKYLVLLPGFFIVNIIRAINEDMTPKKKPGRR